MLVQDPVTGQVRDDGYGAADGLGFAWLPLLTQLAPMLPDFLKALTGGNGQPVGYAGYGYGDDVDTYGADPGDMVYDGFGNPLGFSLTSLVSSVLPAVRNFLPGLFPSASPSAPPAAPLPIPAPPMPFAPPLPFAPPPPFPPSPFLNPFLRMMPPGWVRPPLPFTGQRPTRAYMRCNVWPGQPGLVPATATPPTAFVPAIPLPGPGAGPMRRHHRRRR